jgi:hypothetical protein
LLPPHATLAARRSAGKRVLAVTAVLGNDDNDFVHLLDGKQ